MGVEQTWGLGFAPRLCQASSTGTEKTANGFPEVEILSQRQVMSFCPTRVTIVQQGLIPHDLMDDRNFPQEIRNSLTELLGGDASHCKRRHGVSSLVFSPAAKTVAARRPPTRYLATKSLQLKMFGL
ncbi:hypothetical protein DPEC_G00238570 [Dallia pectoralis]|uniref:Uncharacterized protein n=1 Tax=Dallia pectoralis TaxID=75939 RepID=A0ACC2FZ22_DALPE|nr:hypothetical protein DPEC_G00238570 [Dallia pectoralis]